MLQVRKFIAKSSLNRTNNFSTKANKNTTKACISYKQLQASNKSTSNFPFFQFR